MVPIRYSVKEGVTHFHYKPSELIRFVRLGKKEGNVGLILTKRKEDRLTYRGFGTIEHPFYNIATITMQHSEILDGHWITDEQRLIPPKDIFTSENTKIIILNL